MQFKSVCVFASSSPSVDTIYFAAAERLGILLAERNIELIYGGGKNGLMGALARAIKSSGGKVTGIIPEAIHRYGVAYPEADEMIITQSLRERKSIMEERSDAFIALPGGFGTLEELLEIITLKQLGFHQKPIVIMNVNRFYDSLDNLFEHLYRQRFAQHGFRELYNLSPTVEDIFIYLDQYRYTAFPSKLNG